jgi:hypothetical protein
MPGESAPPRPIDAAASPAAAPADAHAGADADRAAGAPPADPQADPATADPRAGPGASAGRRSLPTDAAVVFGLAGVAVTQPVLDLFGANPTFFVAGRYGDGQIVAFALLVALVPGLAVLAATAPFAVLGRRAGALAHGLAVTALAGVFALAVCRTVGVDGLAPAVGAALAAAVVVAVVEARSPLARRFLGYLAIGNLAFVVVFLVASPTAELLGAPPAADLGTVEVPPLEGPVVVVVLDELPVTALLRPDGSLNEARYPNFARLAASSTWFRDAASESSQTAVSVPSLLTGVRASDAQVPTDADHPRNYYTLFGDRYPVDEYSPVVEMCPPDLCPREDTGSLGQMVADASVVYRHRVLPARLRDGLPDVDQSWGRFGDSVGVQAPTSEGGGANLLALVDDLGLDELTPSGQAAALARRTRQVGPEPSVNLVHVMLPHTPYRLTPWGPNADTWEPGQVPADPSGDQRSIYRDMQALQALQVGALDVELGRMIDHLEAAGAWDDALVVVTSDHGIDATAPVFGREPDEGNLDELLRIPLFIKAPGQAAGAVSDEPASTIDVLPSIIDLLGIETDWEVEGHSLFDGSEPRVERELTTGFGAAVDIVAGRTEQFAGGDGWDALAGVGPAQGLVGSPVSDHVVGDPSPLGWTVDRRDLLDDLSLDGEVPYLLRATVSGDAPVELVVALNGRIAGAVASYGPGGGATPVSGVMAPYFRDGHNDVEAFQVSREGDRVVLHPVREAG